MAGDENRAAIDGADIVILAIPYAAVAGQVAELAPRLEGKIVMDVVNPIERVDGVFRVEEQALQVGQHGQHGLARLLLQPVDARL